MLKLMRSMKNGTSSMLGFVHVLRPFQLIPTNTPLIGFYIIVLRKQGFPGTFDVSFQQYQIPSRH